jgi:outer membrane lipoprotein-sorting protein
MMKKIYYLIIALGMIAGSADAQNDPNAKKVLDAVSAKLKTYKGINANFNLMSKGRAGKVNNNVAGRVSIKGNKYYIKQGATEIFSDGNKTWNYNGNDEVTVNTVDADEQTLSPQKLLTNFYDKDFTYKLISSAGNFNEIQLVPNDKRKNFQKVNVFVDKSKMMITKARVLDKSNNTIEFNLSNVNTAANIPDNTFVFDKNKYKKNIEVIE